jgi:hypothetical protein
MTIAHEEKSEFRRRDRWLLFATIVGPLSVLSNLTISYSLVPTACREGTKMLLHFSALTFVLISLCGAFIGRHYARQCDDTGGVLWRERTLWVARVALVLALGSAMVIAAMEIPNLILGTCD